MTTRPELLPDWNAATASAPSSRGKVDPGDGPNLSGGDEFVQLEQLARVLRDDERRELLRHEQRHDAGPQLPLDPADSTITLPADDHEHARSCQRAPQSLHRRPAADVDDQLVSPRCVGEVVPGVVDDVVGPQRTHQVGVAAAAHAGDDGAGGDRQLDDDRADRAGGADDEYPLPWFDPASVV